MTTDWTLVRYYSARASEYEGIYERPERQHDLVRLGRTLAKMVAGERVLELGCGTGYWTRVMARSAAEILAIDASRASVDIARTNGAFDNVRFEVTDLEACDVERHAYSMVVAGFLWSHIPLQEFPGFLAGLAARLGSGTRAVFFDNRYVEGRSTPISYRDSHGNSYQRRELASGERFTIIKNFPARADLFEAARRVGSDVRVKELEYFWLLRFSFRSR